MTNIRASKGSAQATLCVVQTRRQLTPNVTPTALQIKSSYGNRSVERNTNNEHAASHTTALYRLGFALDRQRTTGTQKQCRRQGSKRRTPNLPYLDWRGGGYIFRLLGIFITIPAHWIPTLTPPTDVGKNTATLRCL